MDPAKHLIEVTVEAEGWEVAIPGVAAWASVVATSALDAASDPCPSAEVSVLLTSDGAVRELNRVWRGVDRPTNVLSFPALDGGIAGRPTAAIPLPLGDVALALETVLDEARAEGKQARDHLAHLVVHGVLHLLGLDHGDDDEAERMERLEAEILARLGIADPYALEVSA